MNDFIGRIFGIIIGVIILVIYENVFVKFIGLSEIISCIFLLIFYQENSFILTKIIAITIYVPILIYHNAYIPAMLILFWDVFFLL